MKKSNGFTLVELMVVITVFGVIAASMAGLVTAQVRAVKCEAAAKAFLEEFPSAQEGFSKAEFGHRGEQFATVRELAAAPDVGGKPLLSRQPDNDGILDGYRFHIDIKARINGTPDRRGYWRAFASPVDSDEGMKTFWLDCFGVEKTTTDHVFGPGGSVLPPFKTPDDATWVVLRSD